MDKAVRAPFGNVKYDPSEGLLRKIFPSLILASSSPNRREYLESLGMEVTQVKTDAAETEDGDASLITLENAKRKMDAYLSIDKTPVKDVITLDTLVALDGKAIGKPDGVDEARAIISSLSGRWHTVYTSLVLFDKDKGVIKSGTETTFVKFKELSGIDVNAYINSGDWEGAAGGYRIQRSGGRLVEEIDGDWTNVIGIPVLLLLKLKSGGN